MAAPFEILAGPVDIYLAPFGTAFPDVDATPGVAWELLGTTGAVNYAEDGVTVNHEQTVETYRGLRGTGPIKAFRTAETFSLGLTLVDISLEQYAKVLNDVSVASAAGVSSINLHQGPDVAVFALVCKSANGPYGDGLPMQYQVPKVFQGANPALVYKKGTPAGLAITFTVLEDITADEAERFGQLVALEAGS